MRRMAKRLLMLLLVLGAALAVKAEIVINEVCPSNTRHVDRGWNYGGWVELHNTESYPQDLYGFYLSDDASNLRKFRITQHITIPSNGYVVFYGGGAPTDTLQMKFDLDCDGGFIYFADRIGRKLAEVEYPVAMPDIVCPHRGCGQRVGLLCVSYPRGIQQRGSLRYGALSRAGVYRGGRRGARRG